VMAAWFLVGAGCESNRVPGVERLAVGPAAEALEVQADYALRALDAAGGLAAWSKVRMLELGCVVKFYQADGSYYLTEQRYEVFPWSNAIRISGAEPGGAYVRQSVGGRYSVLQGRDSYAGLETAVDDGCLAEGIVELVTAPVQLLERTADFLAANTTVKADGVYYYPIKRVVKAEHRKDSGLREAGFYQHKDSGRVEMVLLRCGQGDGVLAVRGHEYKEVEEGGVLVPSVVEIFKSDAGGKRSQLVRIDVKRFSF